ncbi:MAG: biosynthetic-type acetolactate synthase large subunit [SAR202 cluster bacterium]|nr:biosynthetic-type acetolactate synthase large subunit [SAR202 cluster bacterium]
MQMTGARVVCEALLREGVDVIFGHPGGAALPLYDALWHYPQLRHILVRHEQAAAHAAEAYARVTGRAGVCVATSGPGATNLVTGLAAAKMDSTPIVAITGQVARGLMGTEAFQECATTEMVAPIVKKAFLVMDTKDIAPIIHEAFVTAMSGRPGPVLIDLPKDVQAELMEAVLPPLYPHKNGAGGPALPAADLLREAARLLNEAERPLLIVGNGVHIASASDALRELAEKTEVPVINTLHGIGAFPRSHRLALGMLGMHGMYWCNIATTEADLIVGVGMRFDDRVIGRPGTFGERAKIIQINVTGDQIGKTARADLGLLGDARLVLEALLPLTQRRERKPWFDRIAELQRKHPSLDIPDMDAITPQLVMAEVNKAVARADDPIVVTGVGQHQMWAAQFIELDLPRSFVTSGGLGVMGFEVPAAIGAQVGRPNATVWAVCGDGGFQMTLQELATVAQEHLPVKYVIINNGYLGMVREWQELFYEHHYKSVSISSPDYVKLADAYGIPALVVTNKEDVRAAIEEAERAKGPFLLDMRVAPEENVYPMVPPGASLAETVEDPRVVDRRQKIVVGPEGTVSYP